MDENVIQRKAERCYGQFVSSPPHRNSFIGGFHVGAMWAFALCNFEPCPTCEGTGEIDYSDPEREAYRSRVMTCWRCKGDKGWPRKPARAAGER